MNVSPNDSGTVVVNQSVVSVFPVKPSYDSGTEVTLQALPAQGFKFNKWSGDVTGGENPITLIIDCNKTVTANFSQSQSYWWIIGIASAGMVLVCMIIFITVKVRRH